MAEARHPRKSRKQSKWTWTIPLALVAILVALYFAWPAFQTFVDEAYAALGSGEQERVEQWVKGFGAWGFAVIVALMFMQTILAFLPSLLIMVVAVLAYGSWLGGTLTWGGLLMAAVLGYAIGRSLGPVTVDRLIGTKAELEIERFVDRYGLWAIIAARISPVLSTDAVSIVAGLARMRFWQFLVATGVGTLPLTVVVAYLGADIDRLESGLIWISLASVAIFIGYVIYDRKFANRDEAEGV